MRVLLVALVVFASFIAALPDEDASADAVVPEVEEITDTAAPEPKVATAANASLVQQKSLLHVRGSTNVQGETVQTGLGSYFSSTSGVDSKMSSIISDVKSVLTDYELTEDCVLSVVKAKFKDVGCWFSQKVGKGNTCDMSFMGGGAYTGCQPKKLVFNGMITGFKGGRSGRWMRDAGEHSGKLRCDRTQIGLHEAFEAKDIGGGWFGFKSGRTGKWCAADPNYLICNRNSIGHWEKFYIKNAGGGKVGIKSARTGKWCADDSGTIRCNRNSLGAWEKFLPYDVPKGVADQFGKFVEKVVDKYVTQPAKAIANWWESTFGGGRRLLSHSGPPLHPDFVEAAPRSMHTAPKVAKETDELIEASQAAVVTPLEKKPELQLAQEESQVQGTNWASGKPAKQSDCNSGCWGGIPARAVDGNTNTKYGHNSCTHTRAQGGRGSWWQVDLQRTVAVDRVKIWNRSDCCSSRLNGFSVKVAPKGDSNFSGSKVQTCIRPNYFNNVGSGTTYHCQYGPARGRYVRVTTPNNRYLSLCEVQVFGQTENGWPNVARNKPTSQSSTGYGVTSGKAVDGNTNTAWGGQSCTHTHRDAHPWWQVDLQKRYEVEGVAVWNRGDCCGSRLNGMKIAVKPSSGSEVVCGSNKNTVQGFQRYVPCPANAVGRYVKVSLDNRDYLTLCEVEVYGHERPPTPSPTHPPVTTGPGTNLFVGVAVTSHLHSFSASVGINIPHNGDPVYGFAEVATGLDLSLAGIEVTVGVEHTVDSCRCALGHGFVAYGSAGPEEGCASVTAFGVKSMPDGYSNRNRGQFHGFTSVADAANHGEHCGGGLAISCGGGVDLNIGGGWAATTAYALGPNRCPSAYDTNPNGVPPL